MIKPNLTVFVFKDLFLCVSLCVCLSVYVHECMHAQTPAEGIRSLGAGVTGHCEPPSVVVGARNRTRDLMTERQALLMAEVSLKPYFNILTSPGEARVLCKGSKPQTPAPSLQFPLMQLMLY